MSFVRIASHDAVVAPARCSPTSGGRWLAGALKKKNDFGEVLERPFVSPFYLGLLIGPAQEGRSGEEEVKS